MCLKAIFCLWGMPQALFPPKKYTFPEFWTLPFFNNEFFVNNSFVSSWFGEISFKTCSYGPYGPFQFSVKNWFWLVNTIKNPLFGKMSLFEISFKWIDLIWVYFTGASEREDTAAAGAGRPRQPRGINWKASWELGITARTPTVWALFGEYIIYLFRRSRTILCLTIQI